MLDPPGKITQFHIQNSSLNIVQKSCVTVVMELTGLPVLTIEPNQGRESGNFGIVRCDCPTIAQAPQGLERVKAKTARQTKRARPLPLEGSSQSLCRVLDDCN